jgi:tetratricopeptide (TPR) repeat protein
MTTQTKVPYRKDPRFKAAMEYFQKGEWSAGLAALDDVQNEYPNADDLGTLRQEMLLKTHIDDHEVIDEQNTRRKKLVRNVIQITLLAIAMVFVYWGFVTFNSWIFGQFSNIQQNVLNEFRSVELAISFRDAQSYLAANQPDAALGVLEEIASVNPDYPGLDELISQAQGTSEVKTKYENAMRLYEQGDFLNALEAFEQIQEIQPEYLDVSIKIQEIQGQFYLLDLLDQAENAFEDQDWELASSLYETLRAIAPEYRTELVEQRLIRSYMNIASEILGAEDATPESLVAADTYFRKVMVLKPREESLLAEQNRIKDQFKDRLFQYYVQAARDAVAGKEDSLEAIQTAKSLLNKALLLKPENPEVLREVTLVNAYVQSQIDFDRGLIEQAIANLEKIYSIDPGYAGGTALQTLYESYMERGNDYSATGNLEAALEDFQRASEIAAETDDPLLKLYFAKVKIAETVGVLNNYATAVTNYNEAVEIINLGPLLEAEDPERAFLLREAERYAGIEWYRTSYRLYRRVLPATDLILDTDEIITVGEGDYLANLARSYGTTVREILKANELSSADTLQVGQKLVIPTLKESDN